MRKLFSLLLFIALVTSAFAFANSFQINSQTAQQRQQDISSGAAAVSRCNDNVAIDLIGGNFDLTRNDFVVDRVRISTSASCEGDLVRVTLTGGNSVLGTAADTYLDAEGKAEASFAGYGIRVNEVQDVRVLIESANNSRDWQ